MKCESMGGKTSLCEAECGKEVSRLGLKKLTGEENHIPDVSEGGKRKGRFCFGPGVADKEVPISGSRGGEIGIPWMVGFFRGGNRKRNSSDGKRSRPYSQPIGALLYKFSVEVVCSRSNVYRHEDALSSRLNRSRVGRGPHRDRKLQ